MFKVKSKPCPEITSNIFMEKTNNHYDLTNRSYFITPQVNSSCYGTESVSYLGPKIWYINLGSEASPKEVNKASFVLGSQDTVITWFCGGSTLS